MYQLSRAGQGHLNALVLVLFPVLIILTAFSCSNAPESVQNQTAPTETSPHFPVPVYRYEVVNAYPHDQDAFTEGLAFDDGIIYEGTGLYGKSALRKIDLETGRILQERKLPEEYFGEGITVYGDSIVQLTWRAEKGFVYNKKSLELLREFSYQTEGWGITHDEKHLIMSDGSSTLFFLDPADFGIIGHIDVIDVYDNDTPVDRLNELEYIDGRIYANVWKTDRIAIISPQTGRVTGWVDLTGLLPAGNYGKPVDVLNGIAFDAENNRLFVTGKLWPLVFEIKVDLPTASGEFIPEASSP